MRPDVYGLAIVFSVAAAGTTVAGERYGDDGYPGGYGFAGEAIAGSYIGAPLTRFPRPSELVPPAWGYGTYGVPTVAGIRQAPAAAPTLTVINGYEPPSRQRGPRISSRAAKGRSTTGPDAAGSEGSGVRVISVTVPRR